MSREKNTIIEGLQFERPVQLAVFVGVGSVWIGFVAWITQSLWISALVALLFGITGGLCSFGLFRKKGGSLGKALSIAGEIS